MHRILGAKGIFRACDADDVPQDIELSEGDVFSYFLQQRIKTDHTFHLKVEDITCGIRKRCASCQSCASLAIFFL